MKRIAPLLLLLACSGPEFAADDFSYSDENWALVGGSNLPSFGLEKAGDISGPHVCGRDTGTAGAQFWRFQAPPKYSGNASASFGKRITWDQKTIIEQIPDAPLLGAVDLYLKGRGTTLVLNVPNVQRISDQWVSFSVRLDTSEHGAVDAGWVIEADGRHATDDDIKSVLSTLTSVQLPGEWRVGYEKTCIDNVYFGTP